MNWQPVNNEPQKLKIKQKKNKSNKLKRPDKPQFKVKSCNKKLKKKKYARNRKNVKKMRTQLSNLLLLDRNMIKWKLPDYRNLNLNKIDCSKRLKLKEFLILKMKKIIERKL